MESIVARFILPNLALLLADKVLAGTSVFLVIRMGERSTYSGILERGKS